MSETPQNQSRKPEKSRLAASNTANDAPCDENYRSNRDALALPAHIAGSGTLDQLVENARDYAKASTAENTNKAYAADWRHFARWCRLKGTDPLPPSPEVIEDSSQEREQFCSRPPAASRLDSTN